MISIAMATYNGARFIREQIDSILKQTIQDFELVICDDCSTDETWDILQDYKKVDGRLRIYRNEMNLGYIRNFERAMTLCAGDYIALSDQDDIWYPYHLEVLKNNIGDNMLICAEEDLIKIRGERLNMTIGYQQRLDRKPKCLYDFAMTSFYYRSPWMGAVMMMKKDFLPIALPIPEDAHNHDSWFSLLSCFYGGFKYVDIPISQFRQHGNNASGKRFHRKRNPVLVVLSRIFTPIKHSDRPVFVSTILQRIPNLSKKEIRLLSMVRLYYRRNKTFVGRIKNALFEIQNFRIIYTYK